MTPAETPTECAAEKENFTGLRRVRKGWEKGRCKSCGHEYYVDGDDPMNSVAEYAEHSLHAHRLIAAKDARIRELVGVITAYMESPVHGDHKGIYSPTDCCEASAQVRAALARSEDE